MDTSKINLVNADLQNHTHCHLNQIQLHLHDLTLSHAILSLGVVSRRRLEEDLEHTRDLPDHGRWLTQPQAQAVWTLHSPATTKKLGVETRPQPLVAQHLYAHHHA